MKKTPFEDWADRQGLNPIPADEFDYRGVIGPEECDRIAADMLAIAHEMATLLHTEQVRPEDLAAAHEEIYGSLTWALRWLGIPRNGTPEKRASIRTQYLGTDPGPQKLPVDCYLTPVPANDADGPQAA